MQISPFQLAERFIGTGEIKGAIDNPLIVAMLKLDHSWPDHDEVPWCSAFVNFICWLLRLPRSKDLRARSWLGIGWAVDLSDAKPQCDVVVLRRGLDGNAGPDVLDAPGHVGFYAGRDADGQVRVLAGNQSNTVSVARFPPERILGVRRLWEDV